VSLSSCTALIAPVSHGSDDEYDEPVVEVYQTDSLNLALTLGLTDDISPSSTIISDSVLAPRTSVLQAQPRRRAVPSKSPSSALPSRLPELEWPIKLPSLQIQLQARHGVLSSEYGTPDKPLYAAQATRLGEDAVQSEVEAEAELPAIFLDVAQLQLPKQLPSLSIGVKSPRTICELSHISRVYVCHRVCFIQRFSH
jgi:hypothetical protein